MSGMWASVTAAIALLVFWLFFTQRQRLRESEQIRDALVSAVHECRAEIARLRLADEEREAIWTVSEVYAENDEDPECERISRVMYGLWQRTK